MVIRPCTKVGYPGHVVTQKQDLATFGTRAQACTTRKTFLHPVQVSVLLYRCRNQTSLEGRDRGERQFSPGLYRTSQQSVQAIGQIVRTLKFFYGPMKAFTTVNTRKIRHNFPKRRPWGQWGDLRFRTLMLGAIRVLATSVILRNFP